MKLATVEMPTFASMIEPVKAGQEVLDYADRQRRG